MSNLLHVCLYNVDPTASEDLTTHISRLNFVRFEAEVSTPEQLSETLHQSVINLVFFHLDPDPRVVLPVIEEVSDRFPEIAMVALSHGTGPDAILAPIRAGCDQFVCEPIDADDLASAVSRVAAKRLLSRTKSRCVCVVGASGGAGATSIACNLALETSVLSEKVCALVDMDFQFGDVGVMFDCEPKYTFYDLATSGEGIDRAVLDSVITELPCRVALLARPERVEQWELISPDTVHHTVDLLKSSYETVIIDAPRRLDALTFAAIGQADIILVICQLIVPSIRNAVRYFESLIRLGIPEERIQVVVNRGDGNSGRVTTKDIENAIHKPVFAVVPNDYQFVARSLDFGRPNAAMSRTNPVRKAIGRMAKRVRGADSQASGEKERKGLLRRILSRTN